MLRTLALVQLQSHQTIKPYQQLRYWSNVPFRHGPVDVVKYSATPSPDNPARPLQKSNPNGMQDELIRHVQEDSRMSSFDFGVQFLDPDKMTYWGKRQDANFWIENASVEWNEAEAPFHTIARLTLLPKSHLPPDAAEAAISMSRGTRHPTARPWGASIAPAGPAEVASRKARMQAASRQERGRRLMCSRPETCASHAHVVPAMECAHSSTRAVDRDRRYAICGRFALRTCHRGLTSSLPSTRMQSFSAGLILTAASSSTAQFQ